MKAKSIVTLGLKLNPTLLDTGVCYFRTLSEILRWTAMLGTSTEAYGQASTSMIESCSGNIIKGLTTLWCWRKKSMMVRHHHTTTPTVRATQKLTVAWDRILMSIVENAIWLSDTKSAHSMDKSRTLKNQTATQVKRLGFSTHTDVKSSLIKTSTMELDTLLAAAIAEHIVNRDSPDDGWFHLIWAHCDTLRV